MVAAASGSQRRIERYTSGALDKEVEADGDDAEEQQRGVRAQEPGLGRADAADPARTRPLVPPTRCR